MPSGNSERAFLDSMAQSRESSIPEPVSIDESLKRELEKRLSDAEQQVTHWEKQMGMAQAKATEARQAREACLAGLRAFEKDGAF